LQKSKLRNQNYLDFHQAPSSINGIKIEAQGPKKNRRKKKTGVAV
jgi:hypothetical protein